MEKERLLSLQNDFLKKFTTSAYGKLCFKFSKEIKNSLDKNYDNIDENLSVNREFLRRIHSTRIRQLFCTVKYNLLQLKYCNKKIGVKKDKNFDYLSVVCIVKDVGRDIKEWLDFYKMMGVDRIYLYDNGSEDNLMEVIKPYIESGYVVYTYYPGRKVQIEVYDLTIRRLRNKTKWLAIIDSDEFLFSSEGKNLKEVLKEYEEYPGVGVNWVVFGPSGNEKRPKGNVVDNYFETFEDRNNELNLRVKSIVQPKEVLACVSPHFCLYKKRRFAVDENFNEMVGDGPHHLATTPSNSIEKLRINHYWTKSLEDLEEKCKRGYADGCANANFQKTLKQLDYPMIEDKLLYNYLNNKKENDGKV